MFRIKTIDPDRIDFRLALVIEARYGNGNNTIQIYSIEKYRRTVSLKVSSVPREKAGDPATRKAR